MTWDIHGQPLERGHCEVHPWVHMEYPCNVCLADNERRQLEKQQEQDYAEEMERAYYEDMELEMQILEEDALLYWKDGE